jgi:serine/threonine protein kinase
VDPGELELISFGGQGQIYKWEHQGKHYVIKAVLNDESVFRRLNQMREAVERLAKGLGQRIPEGILKRAFPVGRGWVDNPEELGFDKSDQMTVIVYNWIDGEPLDSYLYSQLCSEPPLSSVRVKLAKQVLELLAFLEKAGIANYDMFPDNFVVDPLGQVYIIDMEGAGLFDPNTRTWVWTPVALGKNFPGYCKPPEFDAVDEDLKVFSYRWIGASLVFHILFGVSPFAFMRRIDLKALLELYDYVDKGAIAWPPYGAEKTQYVNPRLDPAKFRTLIRSSCGVGSRGVCPLEMLAFLTFISGFDKPAHRPSFEFARLILSEVLAL